MLKGRLKTCAETALIFLSYNIKIVIISFIIIVLIQADDIFFFIYASRYFMAVAPQPRTIKTMKHKSIAYLSLHVIHILFLHLFTVILFNVLVTKGTLNRWKGLLLLMLKLLQNHLLRQMPQLVIVVYFLYHNRMPVTFGWFYLFVFGFSAPFHCR